MGRDKDAQEEAASRWTTAAEINGYRCDVCGSIPSHEEREVYFDTGMCGYCAHQAQKDD